MAKRLAYMTHGGPSQENPGTASISARAALAEDRRLTRMDLQQAVELKIDFEVSWHE